MGTWMGLSKGSGEGFRQRGPTKIPTKFVGDESCRQRGATKSVRGIPFWNENVPVRSTRVWTGKYFLSGSDRATKSIPKATQGFGKRVEKLRWRATEADPKAAQT